MVRHHPTEDVLALYPETCGRQGEHLGQRSRCGVGWEARPKHGQQYAGVHRKLLQVSPQGSHS